MEIRKTNSCCTDFTYFFLNSFIECKDMLFARLFDTLKQYIKVIIMHPTLHFFCICNVSKYCNVFVWNANKVKVWAYVVFLY